MLTAQQFMHWLNAAGPRETIVYFSGSLAYSSHFSPAIKALAELTWDAYEADRVCLTQRRVGLDRYDYIATRRCHPTRKPAK